MDKKYGDCILENDDFKFIWGVESWKNDFSKDKCNFLTMNDIDIMYDKKKGNIILILKQHIHLTIKMMNVNI